MSGDSGRSAENVVKDAPKALTRLDKLDAAGTNANIRDVMSRYRSGGLSLKDVMGGLKSNVKGSKTGWNEAEARQRIATKGGGAVGAKRERLAQLEQVASQNPFAASALAGEKAQLQKDLDWETTAELERERKSAAEKDAEYGQQVEQDEVENQALQEQLVYDPTTGSMMAGEQVRGDPTLSKLFGDKGLMSRVDQEEQDLSKRGYSLQQEDHEAYGQTAGNLARMFGQQEQDIAASLASRGLAAAPSGAAGVAYSGLAGNKMEQLARAQTDVAQKRMQNTMQRVQQNRQMMQGLGQEYGNQQQNQYNRNLAGVQARRGGQVSTAGMTQQQQGMQQAQANAEFGQKEQTRTPDAGEVMGNLGTEMLGGLGGAVTGAIGQAAGAGLKAAIGSDIRIKKNVEDGDEMLEEMFEHMSPKKFEYKDPAKEGRGTFLGIMAQDLEKSKAGSEMVSDTKDGKRVHMNLGTILAGQGMLHDRLKKVEGRK